MSGPVAEPLPASDAAASLRPGNELDLSRIDIPQPPIYFGVPSGLDLLVHLLVETVEKRSGKRSSRFRWKLESAAYFRSNS